MAAVCCRWAQRRVHYNIPMLLNSTEKSTKSLKIEIEEENRYLIL